MMYSTSHTEHIGNVYLTTMTSMLNYTTDYPFRLFSTHTVTLIYFSRDFKLKLNIEFFNFWRREL